MAHVFMSYVRENAETVDKLCKELRDREVNVWLDREQIRPGQRWQQAIRTAIQEGAFYIACFSHEYAERIRTYMNEELTVAVEELRMRPVDRAWFIPVRLSDIPIPDRSIGGGETLRDIQWVDLFSDWGSGLRRILEVIHPAATAPLDASKPSQSLRPEAEEFGQESVKLTFQNGTELIPTGIVPVLEAYYQDLIAGRLVGFRFANSQIEVQSDPTYDKLQARLQNSTRVDLRRLVRKLEQFLSVRVA
jgi:hypothetical protein